MKLGKNKIVMIVIIALLLILLSAIVFLTVYTLSSMNKQNQELETPDPQTIILTPEQIEPMSLSDTINTNLLVEDDGKDHVIRLSVSLGVNFSDKKAGQAYLDMLTTKEPIIRDIIIGVVRKKTYSNLRKESGQEELKSELLERLQNEFQSTMIYSVVISDIYMQ